MPESRMALIDRCGQPLHQWEEIIWDANGAVGGVPTTSNAVSGMVVRLGLKRVLIRVRREANGRFDHRWVRPENLWESP